MSEHNADNHESFTPEESPALTPELTRLSEQLDARGAELRAREGLVDRIHAESRGHLPAPATLPFSQSNQGWIWGRVALAACVLLAFAVAVRMFSTVAPVEESQQRGVLAQAGPDITDLDYALPTESDTVLVTLLNAGSNGRIEPVDDLEGSDSVGAAFAPILGTTGLGFDDYLAEISLIEVDLRR